MGAVDRRGAEVPRDDPDNLVRELRLDACPAEVRRDDPDSLGLDASVAAALAAERLPVFVTLESVFVSRERLPWDADRRARPAVAGAVAVRAAVPLVWAHRVS
jgi:hypothetical protein